MVVARREVVGGGMEWVVGVRRYKINNKHRELYSISYDKPAV